MMCFLYTKVEVVTVITLLPGRGSNVFPPQVDVNVVNIIDNVSSRRKMPSAPNPTRASRSAAASTDAGAAATARGRPVVTGITAVLQDSVTVATVPLWVGRQQNVGYKHKVAACWVDATTPPMTVTTMTTTRMMTRRPSKWCNASCVRLVSLHYCSVLSV